MDTFNKAQHHHLGIGGINCSCCNNIARKGHDKKDRKLNHMARAKVKAETRKEVIEAGVISEDIADMIDIMIMEQELWEDYFYLLS